MSPAAMKMAVVAVLVMLLITAGCVWQVQDWRYGKQLAEQAGLHKDDLTALSNAAATQVRVDQTHYKELSDAQNNQARLRDRLATADLRLSVFLDSSIPRFLEFSRWLFSANRYRSRRRGSWRNARQA